MAGACLEDDVSTLTPEELAVFPDAHDRQILARIKKMSPDELRHLRNYVPKSLREYNTLQSRWVEKAEEYTAEKARTFKVYYWLTHEDPCLLQMAG